MSDIKLEPFSLQAQPTITDGVFAALYEAIVSLDLMPGTKISEAEIARQMDVSRQPVRDAFFRLSNLGLVQIRPQRATVVTKISPKAVFEAQYIRAAIEIQTIKIAAENFTDALVRPLEQLIDKQQIAVQAADKAVFQALDDEFHKTIFSATSKSFAWQLVKDNKAHMDRVRYLSLEFGANDALEDHISILDAIKSKNSNLAGETMGVHLGRIDKILQKTVLENADLFSNI